MKDCDRYPHIDLDYQARAEEHERREARHLRALDYAREAHALAPAENPPVEPKPPAAERIQPEPGFSQSA